MSDPFTVIDETMIAARPLKFESKPVKAADGSWTYVEICEWARIGAAQHSTTRQRVSDLKETQLWPVFEKHYDAWKKGQEVPPDGMPLAAWGGVSAEQIEILKAAGLRSVEDLAQASSSVTNKVRLPDMENIVMLAKRYVNNAGAREMSEALEKKDAEMSGMKDQMAEMQVLLEKLTAPKDDTPKKRGRPAKADTFEPNEVDVG